MYDSESILDNADKYQGNIINNESDFGNIYSPVRDNDQEIVAAITTGKASKHERPMYEETKNDNPQFSYSTKTRAMTSIQDSNVASSSKKRRYDEIRDGRLSHYNM